jgi:hypothetical protein
LIALKSYFIFFIWSYFPLSALAILCMYRRGGKAAPIHTQNELKQMLRSGLEYLVFYQTITIITVFVIAREAISSKLHALCHSIGI